MPTSAAQKKSQSSAGAGRNGSASEHTNDVLMRATGSTKGSDPIPPDNYLYFLNEPSDPRQRLLAWVRSKTIRYGHRCHYCVDEQGNALTLEHIAADYKWTITHTRQTWAQTEAWGVVHKDDEGRLCLSGNVPLPPSPDPGPKKPKKKCTLFFPQYLTKQIQQLSQNDRKRLLHDYESYNRFNDRVKADLMAQARDFEEKAQIQLFARYGITVRTNKKRRTNVGQEVVQISLKEVPEEFVQLFENPVQTDSETSYTPQNGSVQSPHPLVTTENRDTEEKNRGESSSVEAEPNQKPAPPSNPPSAIAVPEPEREQAWEAFRIIMDACGKPVSVSVSGACRSEFFKHPLTLQQRIVEDAAIRADEIWNEPKWTPAPLKYLQSRIWDTEPVKRRTLSSPPTGRQQRSDEAMQKLYALTASRKPGNGSAS